jgi:signal transduction histidine kinase
VNPFRSVGARLGLALLLVVLGALGIAYLLVVPSLQHRLVGTKIAQLRAALPKEVRKLETATLVGDVLNEAAARANARVVLFQTTGSALLVYRDTQGLNAGDVQNDPIALHAASTGLLESGTVTRGGERFAEAAQPVPSQTYILLVSAPLESQLETVHLLQQRILIAGGVALLVALALGYGGSWMFARRIKRLERAADRIAAGRFDEPIVDPSSDELGELARRFDRMREQLAQLDNARREFIANASHELRTPLFSLGGFLELLDDEELDEDTQREFLSTMREQVERLSKLATDLLDLSRMDAGRLRVESQRLDLDEVARTVADEFGAVALASKHPLVVEAAGGAEAVGDPDRVAQIARMLVENALVHTEPGTRVRIRTTSENGVSELEVEDEGPGVPADHAGRVFERFYRIDGTRSSGSGLGLAIARELAGLMGGSVELASKPGRTVFTLRLPRFPVETDTRQ